MSMRYRPVALAAIALLTIAASASGARLDQNLRMQREVAKDGTAVARSAGDKRIRSFIGSNAHKATVNTVVPRFTFFLSYNVVNQGKLQLTGFTIKPYFKAEPFPIGGCSHCTGNGHFNKVKIRGTTLTETVHGSIFITRKTRFAQALTRPGEIGRYKVFGLKLGLVPRPVVLAQGCLAADAPLTNDDFLEAKTLPVVPCTAKVPKGDQISLDSPYELSASAQETITGRASGARWLSLFLTHESCAPDAQAEAPRSVGHAFWFVGGDFSESFTSTSTSPGYFCVYLETGGRFDGIPDGRETAAILDDSFLAGDTLSITGPSTAEPDQEVEVTFSGNASVAEELYEFVGYVPCASTAQKEFSQASGGAETPVSAGAFSKSIATTPLAQSAEVCGYLQLGAPANSVPTGPTLVAASFPISVP
jgi:hypothetical protein